MKTSAPDEPRMDSHEDEIAREYNDRLEKSRSLAEGIRFTLRQSISEADIKVHEIESRVKDLSSTIKKIRDKEYSSVDQVGDLIGARVVCLFSSDLDRIQGIIERVFEVAEVDTKSFTDPDTFGYVSFHFQCTLLQDCSGPRYDAIKKIPFEIQLRAIGMHAWAAVSHYLDYKGGWDVPLFLKREINALSAIFFVADAQFEAAYWGENDVD